MVSKNFEVLNGFWLQGRSRRPPIIEDPMEYFVCCAILEDLGSSKLGGGVIATTNYLSYQQRIKTNQTVIDILDSGRIQHIRQNRTRLIKIASLLLLCCRQMIPIRGHNEDEK